MKSSSYGFLRTAVILLASATLGLAQTSGYNSNNQTNSIRPGALNYVEGQVSTDGQPLTPQAVGHLTLEPGQSLQTGNGYAEVLLTPGAFLRIGPNSQFAMGSVGLADTRVNLSRGQAMIEADQLIDGTRLGVGVDNDTAVILKKGLYEFDANQQIARVLDGKLEVMNSSKTSKIGKGDQVLLANGDNLKKTDFDVNQAKNDSLYVWSEARSRAEANQNQMAAANYSGYVPVRSGWFWDPYVNYYGFWPGTAYLYSPFGFGFYGYPAFYGGFYPGFYGGYYYHGYRGFHPGIAGGIHAYSGFHGGAVGGFHGGRR